ncbi:hypothetical protein SAMN05428989_1370 [Pseudoxanthomonas sp. GM95]|uniref:hypothetical protein n=1 Tax=Pseudoxanthomonas sp. GM95 TaxID=1881043 RepID=UPI0008C4521C|nr:hypothetical protein [Pseudoxanthomonas sp. GM95]SEL07384.1 hypothetical protein SAMN05428989_1370 [Pseudoxanthomonas sp. GM95]
MPKLIALALALSSAAASAAPAITHYEGVAYAASGSVLYKESHWIGDGGARTVLYRCPNGQPFARKQVSDGSAAPDFELVDARAHYREGVRGQGGAREVFSSEGGKEQAKALKTQAAQVIDAGFDSYVRKHWDGLVNGQDTQIAFLVPLRQGNLDLRIQPMASKDQTHQFKLALDAWYGAIAPSITVTYDNASHRLMRFEGVGNIRDAKGSYPKVRIEFPADAVGTATPAQMQDAGTMPLVNRCAA